MWGNLLGWILSIALVAATVSGIHIAKGFDRPTPASGFGDQVVAAGALAPPIPARHLLPDLSGGGGDSAQAVRRAIEAYRADRWAYDRAASGNVPDNFDSLPAVIAIIDAAMSKSEAVLAPFAEQVVTFRTNKPELEAVWVLGEGLVRAAL